MGISTIIQINRKARLSDVADVIGILSGLKPYKRCFSSGDGWATEVDGISVASCNGMTECAMIKITAPDGETLVDGETSHHVMWHWEGDDGDHMMLPRSNAYWVAIGIELIKFFGGKIDFSDCDDIDVDKRERGKVRVGTYAKDGKGWYALQNAKLNLKPLSKKRLAFAEGCLNRSTK